jgi:hypothetical protein
MTSTATPISAATEQEHYHNDNQDQFHGIPPLTAMALFAAYEAFNGVVEVLFQISVQPPRGHEQFRSVPLGSSATKCANTKRRKKCNA